MKDKKILVGVPNQSGFMPGVMVQSLLQLHKPYPCAFMTVERQRVDKARNAICMEGLKKNVDYVLMVDDDNPIPPDTLERFIEDDKDIVIPPILGRNPNKEGVHPLCAFYSKTAKADGKDIRLYKPIVKFRDDGPLHKIDAGGTGCILIKTKVLAKLFATYQNNIFEFGEIKFKDKITVDGTEYDRRTMSEDCEFSERAIDAGFEMWLDDRIRPFHITTFNLIQWKENEL